MPVSNGQPPEPHHHHHHHGTDAGPPLRANQNLPPDRQSSNGELATLTLVDTLERDDRPSFLVEVQAAVHDSPLTILYSNPALGAVDGLLAKISGKHDAASVFAEGSATQLAFRRWVHGERHKGDLARRGNAYMFEGHLWTSVTVQHYTLISGVPVLHLWADAVPGRQRGPIDPRERKLPRNKPLQGRPLTLPPALGSSESTGSDMPMPSPDPSAPKHGPFDYTLEALPPLVRFDPHIVYFRSVDWAATPLGPMASWSAELRCTINAILNNSFPAVIFWGEEVIMIYNESYIQLMGTLHPCMGQSIRTQAPDHWPSFQPLVDHINATGRSLSEEDMLLFVDRHGFSEEAYWSFQFVPVLDSNGYIAGYYQSFFETTDHHLLERRVSSLVEIASQTANARDFQSYWDIALRSLTLNDKDVPFALLYAAERHVSADVPSAGVSSPGGTPPLERCILKGSIGVSPGHPIAPAAINIHEASYIFHPYLIEAARSRKATIVHLDSVATPSSTLDNIDWKGYGDPCRIMAICPILPTTGEQVQGFLILGTNPRRPFDENYRKFVQIMLRLLSTSLASVVLFDEEVRQREQTQIQAAHIQEHLLAQIQIKEQKFQRFAERADVAIFIVDPIGNYVYRNQRWFDLFTVADVEDSAASAWNKIAFPDDIAFCEGIFAKLVMHNEAACFELRTMMPWSPPSEIAQPECATTEHFVWILCSVYPELGPNGEISEIVGNVTDISKQKWAEGIQKLRTDSALESKQHLEHFIDTTSHEMRNPLSAILQCADGILSSYAPEESEPPTPNAWSHFLEQTLDSAQTIAQCAQHMRHIVDDILTISKLDSGLLVMTPVDAQPESIVKHAVKMFEAEAKAADVYLAFDVDHTYRNLNVDWVSLDPTRLLQVLINLITNAIKFTRLETTRHVIVSLAASKSEPVSKPGGIQFNEDRLIGFDHHLEEDWKHDSDLFFLQFSVRDTGRGLSEQERGTLFARFSQASPRTHIHYGGSGLGLFISRRLTELQGGAIGLSSEPKNGSTFSFYIKTRRTRPAMTRKGSIPRVFPEEMRHRAETPLLDLMRPSRPSRTPMIDRIPWSEPTSPRRQNQHGPTDPVPAAHSCLPPEAIGLPPHPGLNEMKCTKTEVLHVLVVEDNLVNQRVLAKQLRNLGCVVSVANHGREALDLLPKTTCWNHDHPDAYTNSRRPSCDIPATEPIPGNDEDLPIELSMILMDWEMPIMNGLTAVEKIRGFERDGVMKGRIPVIGVTANVRQQQIQTAMEAGMDDVVGKPFRVAELLVRMRGIIAASANGTTNGHVKNGVIIPIKQEN